MTAEVAEGTTTSSSTPPSSPPGGGSAAPPSPASPGGGGTSAQPGGAPPSGEPAKAAPETKPAAPDEAPSVKWAQFKKERAEFRRQIGDLNKKYEAASEWEKKYGTLNGEMETLRGRLGDFDALAAVIRANPELATQIREAIAQGGGATPSDGQPSYAKLPPEIMDAIKGMGTLVKQVEEGRVLQAKQAEQQELNKTRRDLQGRIGKLLEAKKLPANMLSTAEAYVLRRVHELGDEAEMDDIPYLFSEWATPMLEWHQSQLTALADGKRTDATLPVVPGSSPPVGASPSKHGLDGEASKKAIEYLQQRGWA